MSLPELLERVRDAAESMAGEGESVSAVIPAEPGLGARLYLVAFEREGELSYLALDERHRPIVERRLVRDTVAVIALAELADEASGATASELFESPFAEAQRALDEAGKDEAAAAAAAVRAAAARVAQVADGPRVATPAYLDRMAAAAAALGAALDEYRAHAEQVAAHVSGGAGDRHAAVARTAWSALAVTAGAGDPANFSSALAASTGAVEALAGDVTERYRRPLV